LLQWRSMTVPLYIQAPTERRYSCQSCNRRNNSSSGN